MGSEVFVREIWFCAQSFEQWRNAIKQARKMIAFTPLLSTDVTRGYEACESHFGSTSNSKDVNVFSSRAFECTCCGSVKKFGVGLILALCLNASGQSLIFIPVRH